MRKEVVWGLIVAGNWDLVCASETSASGFIPPEEQSEVDQMLSTHFESVEETFSYGGKSYRKKTAKIR